MKKILESLEGFFLNYELTLHGAYVKRTIPVRQELVGPLTQLVEYLPFKQRVPRSSRGRPTKPQKVLTKLKECDTSDLTLRPHRLARSRTPAFHAGNTGSNPVGDAKRIQQVAAASSLGHSGGYTGGYFKPCDRNSQGFFLCVVPKVIFHWRPR